ncbi:hypothetical protein BHE74_00036146 [Ensete ventricosum]|nr:hypothetical protein GW17_00033376 [Ensete ventricosum]RWW57077.1 hypothetical protein BHE74_00036146 [Ensete ventricosum]
MASLKTRPLANVADVASWFLALVVVVGLVLLCSLRRDQPPARDGRHRKRACDETYVVGEGETLHTVSDKCGDPFLVERNPHIHDPDDVFPGLVIKLAPSKPRLGRARRIQGRRTRICMNASLRCDHTPVNHEACRKISVCKVVARLRLPCRYSSLAMAPQSGPTWAKDYMRNVGAAVDKPMGATDRKRNKWFVMGKPVVSSSKPRSHLFPRWAHGISGKEPSPPNQPSVETRSTVKWGPRHVPRLPPWYVARGPLPSPASVPNLPSRTLRRRPHHTPPLVACLAFSLGDPVAHADLSPTHLRFFGPARATGTHRAHTLSKVT